MTSGGRIYCKNKYLNYQGTELAKPLLLLHESSRLDAHNENIYLVLLYTGGIKEEDVMN